MAAPSASDIRTWSKVDFDSLDFGDDPSLQRLVDQAVALVTRWTGQSWSTGGIYSGLSPAEGSEPMASGAVRVLTEWLAFRAQEDVAETLSDFDLISSFSAGGYSESRRGGKDAADANRAMLGNLLWPLMTFDKQDEWLQITAGINAPAFGVTEVDWSGQGLLDSRQTGLLRGGLPDDPYPAPTDYGPWE